MDHMNKRLLKQPCLLTQIPCNPIESYEENWNMLAKLRQKKRIIDVSKLFILNGKHREYLLKIFSVFFPIMIMAILTIPNLGNREMWTDEAHSVVLGQRVLQYGYPRVWDGHNLVSYQNGTDYIGNYVEIFLNWFPYYLSAFGLIFSSSLFGIRIWFVILGLFSALYFYRFVKVIAGDRKIAYLALWLYCLSIPIIIYIRVAYYYAPSLLFINMACFYSFKAERGKIAKYNILLAISMVLLFYSNYLFFLILAIALCIYLLYSLKDITKMIKNYTLSIIITLLCILPYAVAKFYFILHHGSGYQTVGASQFITQLFGYIWQIQAYFIPFITFGFMIAIKFLLKLFNRKRKLLVYDDVFITKTRGIPPYCVLAMTVIITNLIFISRFTWDYATRYLIVSIPFYYILSAAFIIKYFTKDRIALIIFVAILISTNILHELPYFIIRGNVNDITEAIVKPPVNFYYDNLEKTMLQEYLTNLRVKSSLFQYIFSYQKDYDNADEAAVKFVSRFVKEDQYIYSMSLCTYSIMYHTNFQIVNLTENPSDLQISESFIEDSSAVKWSNNLNLFNLLYRPVEYIDWVIVNAQDLNDNNGVIPKELKDKITDDNLFERFDIYDYPNAPVTSDIWSYSYTTNYHYSGMVIFRNRLTTSEIELPNVITKERLK